MGRGNERFSKKEVRTRKLKKRQDKEKKKLERKQTVRDGNNLGDMIAYVDQFGNITSEPPEVIEKKTAHEGDTESSSSDI
jgi:S-adenosylmethionine hydrolase